MIQLDTLELRTIRVALLDWELTQQLKAKGVRSCPFCRELINIAANVCRFCCRDLPPNEAPVDTNAEYHFVCNANALIELVQKVAKEEEARSDGIEVTERSPAALIILLALAALFIVVFIVKAIG